MNLKDTAADYCPLVTFVVHVVSDNYSNSNLVKFDA